MTHKGLKENEKKTRDEKTRKKLFISQPIDWHSEVKRKLLLTLFGLEEKKLS